MLFKVLNKDGSTCYSRTIMWYLPWDNQPGAWMPPVKGDLQLCKNGYHLCEDMDVLEWLGPALFEAEYRGECVRGRNKIVVREARLLRHFDKWDIKAMQSFLCDCTERALLTATDCEEVREVVRLARKYIEGEACAGELCTAAKKAYRLAHHRALYSATWDTVRLILRQIVNIPRLPVAGSTLHRATGLSANAIAWSTSHWREAWDAEKKWQYERLLAYIGEGVRGQ